MQPEDDRQQRIQLFKFTTYPTKMTITTQNAEQFDYNPNNLLDALIKQLKLKNDAALSRKLEIAPPVFSKIRHWRLPVGASMLIRMHEVSGISIRELRELMGDRRTKFRICPNQLKSVTTGLSVG